MPRKSIAVIFSYDECTDDRYPVVSLKLNEYIPELMAKLLEEAGFFVDTDEAKAILKVSAWQSTDKGAMVHRIILTLVVWNEQYCGYSKRNRTLQIYSNLAGFGNPTFAPPPYSSPMRRIGELSAELQQAVEFQEFEEAERLKREIQRLSEDTKRMTP